ncbi:MAG: hypothetical protein B6U73_03480 [Desulfurococcales archaeon ex4484_204]|nr:MAG: hypothetical protein B6U73_03480 [Desulfurococcales archaeon ex4484_204]
MGRALITITNDTCIVSLYGEGRLFKEYKLGGVSKLVIETGGVVLSRCSNGTCFISIDNVSKVNINRSSEGSYVVKIS